MRAWIISLVTAFLALCANDEAAAQSADPSAAASSATAAPLLSTDDQWSDTVVVIKAPPPTVVVVKAQLRCAEMWKLTRGNSTVWVMPTLTYAPKAMDWDASCFKRLLSHHARELLVLGDWDGIPPAYRYLPGGQHLKDVVSVESYARWMHAALRVKANPEDYDRLTPQWAAYPFVGQIYTYNQVNRHSYPDDLPGMADAAHVPMHAVPLYTGGYKYRNARNDITDPQQAEACLNSELDRVNWLLDSLPKVVDAWQRADMRTVLANYLREDHRCDGREGNIIDRENAKRWTKALGGALNRPGMAVAAVPLDWWLRKGGALDQLQAAGVSVALPEDIDADTQDAKP